MADPIAEAWAELPPVEPEEPNCGGDVPQVRPPPIRFPPTVRRDRNPDLPCHLPLLQAAAPTAGAEGGAQRPLWHLDPLVPAERRPTGQKRQVAKRHRRNGVADRRRSSRRCAAPSPGFA